MLKTGNSQINTKIYWDYIYTTPAKELDYWKDTNRFPKALDYVKDGDKFIDIGCGVGIPSRLVKRMRKDCEVWGVDLSESVINKNKSEEPDIRFEQGCVGNLDNLPKNYFDVVFAGELIEHLDDPSVLFNDAHRILKKGGKLIVTTPQNDGVISPEHLWYFNKDDVEDMYFNAGFKNLEFVDLPDMEHILVFFTVGVKGGGVQCLKQ